MASFSNLAFDTIRRLRNDETGEITLLFTRDGQPMNITSMLFSVGYNLPQTTNEVVRIDNAALTRPNATTDRLVIDPTTAQRALLTGDAYTIWVYLVVNGKRDPLVYYKFTWETEPTGYVEGQPREPAYSRIDFVTASAFSPTTPIYEVTGSIPGSVPAAASEAAAAAGALPAGAAGQLFIIGGQPFIRIGSEVIGLAKTGADVA